MELEQAVECVSTIDFNESEDNKLYKIHISSICDCEEVLHTLFKCLACGQTIFSDKDTAPEHKCIATYGEYVWNPLMGRIPSMSPKHIINPVVIKVGEMFIKPCVLDGY